ncbi:MAG: TFIIB-type zinc ribbon-containing protein [Salinirussus sp.]
MKTSNNVDRKSNSDHRRTPTHCPDCSGPVRPESGGMVCGQCGLVIEADRIDHGPK